MTSTADHNPHDPSSTDLDARLRQHAVDTFRACVASPSPATVALAISTLGALLDARVWQRDRLDGFGARHPAVPFPAFAGALVGEEAIAATGLLNPEHGAVEALAAVVLRLGKAFAPDANPAGRDMIAATITAPLLRRIAAEARAEMPWLVPVYMAAACLPLDIATADARH